jgi:hypothetical protein
VAGFLSIAQQISSPPYQSSVNHAQADTKKKFEGAIHGFHGSFRSTVSTTHIRNISAGIDVSFSGSDVWILIFPIFVATKPGSGADTLVYSSGE